MSPKVFLQYVLPHRLLSRIAYGVARTRTGWHAFAVRNV